MVLEKARVEKICLRTKIELGTQGTMVYSVLFLVLAQDVEEEERGKKGFGRDGW
jgi:hypothetical protein